MTFSAIECRPVVLLIQVILGLEQVGSVNFIDVTRRPTNVLTSSGRFSETCLMNKVTSNYGRSLSEVHVMFCECYFFIIFYGRLMLRPRLTEVRETFTRGGP